MRLVSVWSPRARVEYHAAAVVTHRPTLPGRVSWNGLGMPPSASVLGARGCRRTETDRARRGEGEGRPRGLSRGEEAVGCAMWRHVGRRAGPSRGGQFDWRCEREWTHNKEQKRFGYNDLLQAISAPCLRRVVVQRGTVLVTRVRTVRRGAE